MATLLEQSGYEALFKFQQVSVVQSIDAAALKVLLSQLLSGQAAVTDKLQAQQQEIDALKADNRESQQLHLQGLDDRLRHLEDLQLAAPHPPAAAALPAVQQSEGAEACAAFSSTAASEYNTALTAVAAAAATQAKPPMQSTALQTAPYTDQSATIAELQRQHAQIAGQLAALQAALATADSKSSQLAGQLGSKADAEQVRVLAEGLRSKADDRGLLLVQKQLAGKADRSELDVLLRGSTSMHSGGVESDAGDTDLDVEAIAGDRVTAAAGTSGADSVQVAKLQLQLALLQERLANKVDVTAAADLSDQLHAARQDVEQLQFTIQNIDNQLAAVRTATKDVQNAQHLLQQQHAHRVQEQNPQTASATIAYMTPQLANQLQQLPLLLPRLYALEDSVAALTAAGAAAAVVQRDKVGVIPCTRTDSRSASATQPSSSLNAMSASNHFSSNRNSTKTAAGDLSDKVTNLQLQMKQMVRPGSSQPDASGSAGRHGTQSPASAEAIAMESSAGPCVTECAMQHVGDTTSNAEETSYRPATAADSSQGAAVLETERENASASAFEDTGAGFAELSARILELQRQIDDLAGAKADRDEFDRLRVMLAETVSQSDAEIIHRKLDSQQSQMIRLAHQLSLHDGPQPASASARPHGDRATPAAKVASKSFKDVNKALADADTDMTTGEASFPGAVAAGNQARGNTAAAAQYAVLSGPEAEQPAIGRLQDQLQQQLASLEMLAEAACLLATGRAAATVEAGTAALGERAENGLCAGWSSGINCKALAGEKTAQASRLNAPCATGGGDDTGPGIHGCSGGGDGPQVTQLRRLLQTRQFGRKLDWFDPLLLPRMAQRLAANEALIKMHPSSSQVSAGGSDVDGRLKRLAADVKMLKEQLGNAAGAGAAPKQSVQGDWGTRDGDHTILASKPLAGYRCMACNRPLASLDPSPGPHLPIGSMPVTVPAGAELAAAPGAALGKLPPAGSRRTTAQDAGPASAALLAAGDMPGYRPAGSPEPLPAGVSACRVTGTQHWYTSSHGLPAEQLPKGDIGPVLPPGGWRGGLPRAENGSVLPAAVPRGGGGSGASGMGGGR